MEKLEELNTAVNRAYKSAIDRTKIEFIRLKNKFPSVRVTENFGSLSEFPSVQLFLKYLGADAEYLKLLNVIHTGLKIYFVQILFVLIPISKIQTMLFLSGT